MAVTVERKPFLAALHMATGTRLAIHHATPEAQIRLVDDGDPDVTRVIMPVRMNRARMEE